MELCIYRYVSLGLGLTCLTPFTDMCFIGTHIWHGRLGQMVGAIQQGLG